MESETVQLFWRVIVGLVACIVILIAVLGFLSVRLSESRIAVTCGSFSSYADMQDFLKNNPGYEPKLDSNHNGIPCENLKSK